MLNWPSSPTSFESLFVEVIVRCRGKKKSVLMGHVDVVGVKDISSSKQNY
jgi:arginine utilization protein RocB